MSNFTLDALWHFSKNVNITETELCFYYRYWGIWIFILNQLVAIKNIIKFSFQKYICSSPKSLNYINCGILLIWCNSFVTCDNLSIYILIFSGKKWISNVNSSDLQKRTDFINMLEAHIYIKIFDVLVKHFCLFTKDPNESVLFSLFNVLFFLKGGVWNKGISNDYSSNWAFSKAREEPFFWFSHLL